ncbi:MAG: hypothetical protein KGM24_03025, partial [Elusimicrobia bacterium]|nr:hypothetical protein [Elusimicrobiota bacterium]
MTAAAFPARAARPEGADALLDAARSALDAGRRAEARRELERAAALPLDAARLTRLIGLYESVPDYCLAADAGRRLVRRTGGASALILYADGAAYCGRRARAAAALEKAFAETSKPEDLDQIAYLFLYDGRPARSVAASDRYLRLTPGDLWHWARRARACAQAGDAAAARAALAREREFLKDPRALCRGLASPTAYDRARDGLVWPAAQDGFGTPELRRACRETSLAVVARALDDCAGRPAVLSHAGLIAGALGDDGLERRALSAAVAAGADDPD